MPREDYEERKAARIERLRERAEKNAAASSEAWNKGCKMASAIPFGQPIHVGHHSEGRDRRYRATIDRTFSKAVALGDKAKHYASKAEAAESNDAISSDDPEAIRLLKAEIAREEAARDGKKDDNKVLRKATKNKFISFEDFQNPAVLQEKLTQVGISAAGIKDILLMNRIYPGKMLGIPGYSISNQTANIKRMKDRLARLEAEAKNAAEGDKEHTIVVEGELVNVLENVSENRLQLRFPGKPSPSVVDTLKRRGFKWSPKGCCWQRMLNSNARYTLMSLLGQHGPAEWHWPAKAEA